MDKYAAVCLEFPPERSLNDIDYDKAIQSHLVKLFNLLNEPTKPLAAHGIQLLELLDPAVNSLSYLAVLHTLCIPALAEPRDIVLEKLVVFLLSFEARQLRYAGPHLLELLNLVGSGHLLPSLVAVKVLAAAILRIDPTSSMLTTTHTHLVKLAYSTNNIRPALQVIDKSIVFYPGMANNKTPELLCDRSLSPSAYVNKETGITAGIKPAAILEYDLLCGLMYCSERDWAKAHAAFERVVTYPTRDHGVSKIMTEAYKKWVLVGLLLHGKLLALPAYTGAAATKAYNTLGKLYQEIAVSFETENAAELKADVEKHTKDWQDDGNTGLIGEALAAYQQWQILNLQHVYSKLSISEIRLQTKSAQTGDILGKDEDVVALVQNMVISGILKGVIEKNDDGTTFLTFLPPSTVLSEGEFSKDIAGTALRLKALQTVFSATNERLGTSKEYIRHLAKEQRRTAEKDTHDSTSGFESHVDDEDMMAGITSTAFEA